MTDKDGGVTTATEPKPGSENRRYPRKNTPTTLSRCELVVPGRDPRPARFLNWSPTGALLALAGEKVELVDVQVGLSVEIRCQDFPGRFRGRVCRLERHRFAVAFDHGVEAYLSPTSPP
jgi:hypothetical protein